MEAEVVSRVMMLSLLHLRYKSKEIMAKEGHMDCRAGTVYNQMVFVGLRSSFWRTRRRRQKWYPA